MPRGVYKRRNETKLRISASLKGKKWSEERRMKSIGKIPWNKGKKMSPKTKEKISISLTGIKRSLETRNKISESMKGEKHWFYGKQLTDEHRKKISDGAKRNGIGLWMIGKSPSDKTRKKLSDANSGSKNYFFGKNKKGKDCVNWKGGITPINKLIRTSEEYKLWRKSVFKRDNYKCIFCGDQKSGNLNADHIKPFAYFPELRFELSNGRTLCKSCHHKTDTYGGKARKYKPTI